MLSITQTHKCLTLMKEEVVLNHAEKKIVIGSGLKLPKSVVFQITLAHLSSNEGEGRIKFQGPILKQSAKNKSISWTLSERKDLC